MTIKHIVLSGGGPIGLIYYGALKILHKRKIWNLKNIRTIYCTSIGSYIAILIMLNYDWLWLDDYLIKRPWDKVFDIENINYILNIINEKGVIGEDDIKKTITPLLLAKEIKETITLKEFYDYTNIELHIFITNINSQEYFEKIDMSYKTYPDISLIKAITMSCSIPILFKPEFFDDKCLIDGGFTNNYPLDDCLMNTKCNEDEILSFKSNFYTYFPTIISKENNLLEYLLQIVLNSSCKILHNNVDNQKKIYNTIICSIPDEILSNLNTSIWIDILKNSELRRKIIQLGEELGKNFNESI